MGGSKPEWADVNDHSTLEEVFNPVHSGDRFPRPRRVAVLPEAITAPGCFSVRNRFVASGAVAAAALSVVAGLSIGAGPMAQSVLSAHAGSPAAARARDHADDDGSQLCRRGRGNGGNRQSAEWAGSGLRRERPGVRGDRSCGRESDTTERRLPADRHPDRDRDGLLRPGRGRNGHVDHDDDNDHDDPPPHHPHHPTTTTTTTTSLPVSSATGGAAPVGGGGSNSRGVGQHGQRHWNGTGNGSGRIWVRRWKLYRPGRRRQHLRWRARRSAIRTPALAEARRHRQHRTADRQHRE